uniref:Glycoside hydrolase family 28 n=1 Tax=Aretaon asperrimus TaxID=173775 RepID=A0A191XSW7_9NEOP|nr:glycoside hydrolase family 28 [Aretaon asperrimus]
MRHLHCRGKPMAACTAAFLLVVMLHCAAAKDLRQVTEPKTPASCTSLKGTGKDETTVIQKALNECAKGKAVHLASGTFVSGPITIPSGVSLWVDSGVTLKASLYTADYDLKERECVTAEMRGGSCKPFITMKNAVGSGIYGKGTIDGQGSVTLMGRSHSWWQLSEISRSMATKQTPPRLIQIDNSKDITLHQITLKNSPNFHVVASDTDGFTVWGVTIDTPASTHNTDGIDPMGARNVTIANCKISTGDDNVAIKAGSAPTQHVSIVDNEFGAGHGMSIGSEVVHGVSDVYVSNLIMDGTTNGLRIKSDRSRGGLVTGITYYDVSMRNVANPIVLTTEYSATATGNYIPEFRDITFEKVVVSTVGKYTLDGYSDAKPVQAIFQDVVVKKGSTWVIKHAKITGKWTED